MLNKNLIKQCHIFAELSAGEIDRVAGIAEEKEYQAGAVLFVEKDPADELLIIQEGKVALQMACVTPPGRAVTIDLASSGEAIGWTVLIEPHVYDLTAVCLQKTRVLAINGIQLRALLREDGLSGKLMGGLVQAVISRLNDTRRLLISERLWRQRIE